MDSYIADLRAATRLGLDIKIFRMNSLGIPQVRIANRLEEIRETIRNHLAKMATLPNQPNTDLSRGFTVSYAIEGPAQEILDAGAEGFIQKPFSLATLSEKLKEALGD